MDIIYKKDTLYVYVKDKIDEEFIETLEMRVDRIMRRYNIENLVVDFGGQRSEHINSFCIRHNSKHKKKILVK